MLFSSAVLRNHLVSFFIAVTCSFQPESTFSDLCKQIVLLYILPARVSEVSMLLFLLLVRKRKYSRNKEIFHLSVPQGSFPPQVSIFGGWGWGKSDWSYNGLLIIRAGQRQHLEWQAGLCLCVGRMWKLETTGISCIGVLGCRKGSDHLDPEDQKVEEVHMPLAEFEKTFFYSTGRLWHTW